MRGLLALVWHGVEIYTHVSEAPEPSDRNSTPAVYCRSPSDKQTDKLFWMTKNSPRSKPAKVQEHPEDAPAGWAPVQHRLAASTGLSILLVNGHQPPALVVSDNNSICHALQTSADHASLCDPYCGDAHRRAIDSGAVVHYKCHAGLECFAMPIQIANERNLAVIGGRAFVTAADYRVTVERLLDGDLRDLACQ